MFKVGDKIKFTKNANIKRKIHNLFDLSECTFEVSEVDNSKENEEMISIKNGYADYKMQAWFHAEEFQLVIEEKKISEKELNRQNKENKCRIFVGENENNKMEIVYMCYANRDKSFEQCQYFNISDCYSKVCFNQEAQFEKLEKEFLKIKEQLGKEGKND